MAPLPFLLLLAGADALPPSCREVVTCAGLVVHYPFSLNSSAYGCGYPGLDLLCDGNNSTLILPVKSHNYRVVGINYQAHTVAVSDEDLYVYGTSSCPRLHANLTIDYTRSWLQLTKSDSNITFLYNCKKNVSLASVLALGGCDGYDGKRSYVLPDGQITGAEAYE